MMMKRSDVIFGTATFVRSLSGQRMTREIGEQPPACFRWHCARLFKVEPGVPYPDEFGNEQRTEFVILSTSHQGETLIFPARENGNAIHTSEIGGWRETTDVEAVLAAYGYRVNPG